MMIKPKSCVATLEMKQLSTSVALPLPKTERTPNGASFPSKTHFSNVKPPPTFEITANVAEFPTKKQSMKDIDIDETAFVIPESAVSGSVGKSASPL